MLHARSKWKHWKILEISNSKFDLHACKFKCAARWTIEIACMLLHVHSRPKVLTPRQMYGENRRVHFSMQKRRGSCSPSLNKTKTNRRQKYFEKLLFLKHSKICCSSRDIYFQSLTTFSAFSLLSCYKHDHNFQGSWLHFFKETSFTCCSESSSSKKSKVSSSLYYSCRTYVYVSAG